jgi:hypothetical protein
VTRRSLALAVAVAISAALPDAATAQNAELKPYTIPPSPAFTFLGTTPGEIDRPTAARAFAAGLVQDFRTAGGIPRGLALDVAPWAFVPGLRIPLSRYQADPVAYVLANTQISLGSIQASGDSADTDLAAGLRTTLYDRGDPMRDTAYTNAVRTGLKQCQTDDAVVPDSTVLACARRVTTDIRTRWREAHWNAASLAVATAAGWRFRDSNANRSDWLGWAGWATAAAPLFRGGQLLGQVRYDSRAGREDGLSYGGRAYLGTPALNVFVPGAT